MTWTTRYALESMMGRSAKADTAKPTVTAGKMRLSNQFMTLNSNEKGTVMVRKFNYSQADENR